MLGNELQGLKKNVKIEFESCDKRKDSEKPEKCMSNDEMESFHGKSEKYRLNLIFSHNFVDYKTKSEYLNYSAMRTQL